MRAADVFRWPPRTGKQWSATAADWRAERAGSLDSLNDLAACAGRRLLERCVVGWQQEFGLAAIRRDRGIPPAGQSTSATPRARLLLHLRRIWRCRDTQVLEVLESREKKM